MSGFFKIPDFFFKIHFAEKGRFSVSDKGDPLILTCLPMAKTEFKGKFNI